VVTSPISEMVRSFPSKIDSIRKLNQFGHPLELVATMLLKDGELLILTSSLVKMFIPRRVK
jgi:hypothetical protein